MITSFFCFFFLIYILAPYTLFFFFYFPFLLRCNWHRALYKSVIKHNDLTYVYCEMTASINLVNIHLLIQLIPPIVSLVVRPFRGYSLSNFQIHHAAVLARVIIFCITSPRLIYLITKSSYLLTTFIQFPSPTPPVPLTLVTTDLISFHFFWILFYFFYTAGSY